MRLIANTSTRQQVFYTERLSAELVGYSPFSVPRRPVWAPFYSCCTCIRPTWNHRRLRIHRPLIRRRQISTATVDPSVEIKRLAGCISRIRVWVDKNRLKKLNEDI